MNSVDIQWRIGASRSECDRLASQWVEFADRDDVTGSVWCDPRVWGHVVDFAGGAELAVAEVRQGDRLVALVPFKRRTAPVHFSVGLFRLGSRPAQTLELVDFGFPAELSVDRLDLLMTVVADAAAPPCDLVILPNCRTKEKMRGFVRHAQTTYLVDVHGAFDDYLGRLSAGSRQTLKRKVRQMGRACALSTRCYRSAAEMPGLREHLQAVWSRSWHGKLGRYAPPAVDFLRDLAGRGWVRAYVLSAGDTPVAYALGYQYKGTFLDEAPAYDERWKQHSPGLVLFHFAVEDLHMHDPPKTIDFGFGYNQYKQMLGTRPDLRAEVWLPLSRRGRLLVAGAGFCDGAYDMGRKIPGGRRFIRSAKQWMKKVR